MRRNPYCQPFNLRSGEIVELRGGEAAPVYLMTGDNLMKYRAGRDDYVAEVSMPFAELIELVAAKAGNCHLVCEQPLRGTYRVRRGLDERTGTLQMARSS